MLITVEIFPVRGRVYHDSHGRCYQVAGVTPFGITIIPEDTSVPVEISEEKFYQLFGGQHGN